MKELDDCEFYLEGELRSLEVHVGLSVELDRLHVVVLVDEVLSVLHEQRADLLHAVLPGQADGEVPLVQADATVHGNLNLSSLSKRNILQHIDILTFPGFDVAMDST